MRLALIWILITTFAHGFLKPQLFSNNVMNDLRRIHFVDFYERRQIRSQPLVIDSIIPKSLLPSDFFDDYVSCDLHLVRLTHPFMAFHRSECVYNDYYDKYLEVDDVLEIDSSMERLRTFHAWKMRSTCAKSPRTSLFFPGANESRGEIARACAYFFSLYPEHRALMPKILDLRLMHMWHMQFPPTQIEIKRNKAVEKIQYNFNAFVDQPHLVLETFKP